jgi:hypothetical protein
MKLQTSHADLAVQVASPKMSARCRKRKKMSNIFTNECVVAWRQQLRAEGSQPPSRVNHCVRFSKLRTGVIYEALFCVLPQTGKLPHIHIQQSSSHRRQYLLSARERCQMLLCWVSVWPRVWITVFDSANGKREKRSEHTEAAIRGSQLTQQAPFTEQSALPLILAL